MKIKSFKELQEEAPAMSVGSGNIAGLEPDLPPVRKQPTIQRRKKFAGKQVFVVDPNTYQKAILGKLKTERFDAYLNECDIADEIREYARKNWSESIILQNEKTGAMVYLKYGSKK
jgi:hypothetical protein